MARTCITHSYNWLIDLIKSQRDDRVISILNRNRNLLTVVDSRGTLMHHAVLASNFQIVQYLVTSGSPIDHPRSQDGKTPLMIAVGNEHIHAYNRKWITRVLLGAGASVDHVDASGESVLHAALHSTVTDFKIVGAVLDHVKAETPTTHMLVDKLVEAGCHFAHAALLGDVEVTRELLRRGFDVHSRNHEERTALHYAVLTRSLGVTKLLLEHGADVNACDFQNADALYYAASRKDPKVMRLLLDHGANPDPDVATFDETPLYESLIFIYAKDAERTQVCAELLLRYGAFPSDPHTLVLQLLEFDENILRTSRVNLLVAHQAVIDLERNEKKERAEVKHLTDFEELKDYYAKCRRMLEVKVAGTMSLFEVLGICGKRKMRLLARNVEFVCQVNLFRMEPTFREVFPYYANRLEKSIIEAARTVELESVGISVISDIFNCNYNKSYIFARGVVDYMSLGELENLCNV